MLEYTIEFLAQNGVEELFVLCVWHAEIIQAYVNNSKWATNTTISVQCINFPSSQCAGDALRDLYLLDLIHSDPFILISGDVISNMDLKRAIAFHKEKRKADIDATMTIVLKPVQRGAGAKPITDDLVVAQDRSTGQLLLFEDAYKKSSVGIPLEILKEHPGMVIRTDLLDCHVDICSSDFISQFSDNFDYKDIRRDFIKSEVATYELGRHIYGYILQVSNHIFIYFPSTLILSIFLFKQFLSGSFIFISFIAISLTLFLRYLCSMNTPPEYRTPAHTTQYAETL